MTSVIDSPGSCTSDCTSKIVKYAIYLLVIWSTALWINSLDWSNSEKRKSLPYSQLCLNKGPTRYINHKTINICTYVVLLSGQPGKWIIHFKRTINTLIILQFIFMLHYQNTWGKHAAFSICYNNVRWMIFFEQM